VPSDSRSESATFFPNALSDDYLRLRFRLGYTSATMDHERNGWQSA
jgi:hypothetical protein